MKTKLIFEWDRNKAQKNIARHKISFDEAKTVFNDPFLITFPDEYHSESEERFISIGISSHNRMLLVVHTEHAKTGKIIVRIISCRKAAASERKIYEE
ncbi:MAG: BrnT family toxin [Deltaproteobacteria bacterium]|nr:MAG: BrnT family toxin [Deltaproteobacteria bacterium]